MTEYAQLPNIPCPLELRELLTDKLRDSPLQLLFGEDGQLLARSEHEGLFPAVTLRALKQRMRSFERSAKEGGKAWLGPFLLRFSRLDGTPETHFLLDLSRGPCFLLGVEKGLSSRQREVTHLAAKGLSLKEAGAELGISENTAKTHLRKAYELIGVRSRLQLARAIETRERSEFDTEPDPKEQPSATYSVRPIEASRAHR